MALHQQEENAVLIGYDKYAKFVDKQGKLKPSNKLASQISFDNEAQAIGKAYSPSDGLHYYKDVVVVV